MDLPPSLLVSAGYDAGSGSAVLKFYDPESGGILSWEDRTGHRPYCYSRLEPADLSEIAARGDVAGIDRVGVTDPLTGREITVSRITGSNPLAIGGRDDSIRNRIETWESDIKYYEGYMYDRRLVVGRYYKSDGGDLVPADPGVPDEVRLELKAMLLDRVDGTGMPDQKQYREYISGWADLLSQPIPRIRRLAVDIEVEATEGKIPDPSSADRIITAVGLKGDGCDRVLVLETGAERGEDKLGDEAETAFFKEEREMLEEAFRTMSEYPFILTYNGDEFDLPYMRHRAERLGVREEANPLRVLNTSATVKGGIHIDLYRTLSNRSFQIYAFGQAYTDFALESVSQALLGRGKTDYGVPLGELTLSQTAKYCYNDALLTYDLTAFDSDLLMDLLVTISRIGRMPIDDISRMGVSQWIRSLLYYEHRRSGYLIPRREELEARSQGVKSDAVIKDKKYRGGLVVDPVEGVHFGVVVMDFASLYPSIIKVRNISYETVRCPHEACKKNAIPQTNHWSCSERNGMTSQIIGSLRDLRVNYYKSLSRRQSLPEQQRRQYKTVSQALKVILNASYGVMGADIFPLYFLPAAEATTAIGRHTILETIRGCGEDGIEVLYGDTDSIFVKDPTEEQMGRLIERAKRDHGVDLEVDKRYRYCVLSGRKKNYFGVTDAGKVDVKGLTGKKSHTPRTIKDLFYELVDVLASVENEDGFRRAKRQISERIAAWAGRLQDSRIPLGDLAFNVMLSKAPREYTKTIPQHIRAARMMKDHDNLGRGDRVSFVKTLNKSGVKPLSMASIGDVDATKYLEFAESVIEQVISPLGIEFDEAVGKPKQAGLEEYFYG
ncbi:MAG: DNA-directed DNA polymerase I [Nitrosopumilus sp.]|nr:DNA-directed DNA polymerase I [Nitrosopumilus sp.]MDA7957494.1 DNA-directed DNA polymerase I [Nitrosopumilus sp.]